MIFVRINGKPTWNGTPGISLSGIKTDTGTTITGSDYTAGAGLLFKLTSLAVEKAFHLFCQLVLVILGCQHL